MANNTPNPVVSKSAPKPAGAEPKVPDVVRSGAALSRHDELEALRKENAHLKRLLSDNGVDYEAPVENRPPSFGMSEGTREELERTGTATDPFTGEKLTADKSDD